MGNEVITTFKQFDPHLEILNEAFSKHDFDQFGLKINKNNEFEVFRRTGSPYHPKNLLSNLRFQKQHNRLEYYLEDVRKRVVQPSPASPKTNVTTVAAETTQSADSAETAKSAEAAGAPPQAVPAQPAPTPQALASSLAKDFYLSEAKRLRKELAKDGPVSRLPPALVASEKNTMVTGAEKEGRIARELLSSEATYNEGLCVGIGLYQNYVLRYPDDVGAKAMLAGLQGLKQVSDELLDSLPRAERLSTADRQQLASALATCVQQAYPHQQAVLDQYPQQLADPKSVISCSPSDDNAGIIVVQRPVRFQLLVNELVKIHQPPAPKAEGDNSPPETPAEATERNNNKAILDPVLSEMAKAASKANEHLRAKDLTAAQAKFQEAQQALEKATSRNRLELEARLQWHVDYVASLKHGGNSPPPINDYVNKAKQQGRAVSLMEAPPASPRAAAAASPARSAPADSAAAPDRADATAAPWRASTTPSYARQRAHLDMARAALPLLGG